MNNNGYCSVFYILKRKTSIISILFIKLYNIAKKILNNIFNNLPNLQLIKEKQLNNIFLLNIPSTNNTEQYSVEISRLFNRYYGVDYIVRVN